MIVGCVQSRPVFGDVSGNLSRLGDQVRDSGADLLVLPELCTTGYLFASREEALELAEEVPDGPTVRALVDLAGEEDVLLCAGLAERVEGVLYNSAVLVDSDGVLLHYRKNHLFADEFDIFAAGDLGFPVVTLADGTRVGLLICFDWVFPEAARALALDGADVILHPSNLVLPYCQRVMLSRAIENGVFILTTNRIGTEERAGKGPLAFSGQSQIASQRGEVLAALGPEEIGLCTAEIDPLAARDKAITHTNDLMADRRPELYGRLTAERDES